MENVIVKVEPVDEGWEIEKVLPLPSLPYSEVGSTYVLLKIPEDNEISGVFNLTLKFQIKDVDPATGEPESDEFYEDIYCVKICLIFLKFFFSWIQSILPIIIKIKLFFNENKFVLKINFIILSYFY